MSIPISDIVNITVSSSPTMRRQNDFSTLLIVGKSSVLPLAHAIVECRSADNMIAQYPAFKNTSEYQNALLYFSQTPSPKKLMVARVFDDSQPAELICASLATTEVLPWQSIKNGAVRFIIDEHDVMVTQMDFSSVSTMEDVATVIKNSLNDLLDALDNAEEITCSFDGQNHCFIITSGTTGSTSQMSYAMPLLSDLSDITDIGDMMLAYQLSGGFLATRGVNAQTISEALDYISSINSNWYALSLTYNPSDDDIQNVAKWAEPKTKIFGYTENNVRVLQVSSTNDTPSILKKNNYKRTVCLFHQSNDMAIVALLAKALAVDLDIGNSMTLKFKQLSSIVPDNLSQNEADALRSKNVNFYALFGNYSMLAEGVMSNGTFFDEVQGLDWFQKFLQDTIFAYLYREPKVPQTNRGVTQIVQQVEKACYRAVENGFLAPGIWNGDPVGQVNTGDFLSKGFYVYAIPVGQQPFLSRSERKAPPIYILAKGGGAIQHVDILVSFEQ